MNSFTTRGPSGSTAVDGTTSSQLLSENPGNRILHCQLFEKLENSSGPPLKVITSSGQSFTTAELCMCTDYSRPLTGQIALNLGELLTKSGGSFLNGSGVAKCEGCGKMRPYRLMSVSM